MGSHLKLTSCKVLHVNKSGLLPQELSERVGNTLSGVHILTCIPRTVLTIYAFTLLYDRPSNGIHNKNNNNSLLLSSQSVCYVLRTAGPRGGRPGEQALASVECFNQCFDSFSLHTRSSHTRFIFYIMHIIWLFRTLCSCYFCGYHHMMEVMIRYIYRLLLHRVSFSTAGYFYQSDVFCRVRMTRKNIQILYKRNMYKNIRKY